MGPASHLSQKSCTHSAAIITRLAPMSQIGKLQCFPFVCSVLDGTRGHHNSIQTRVQPSIPP